MTRYARTTVFRRYTTTRLDRRLFVFGGGALLAGSALPLERLFERSRPGRVSRFGKLERDPHGLFDLPRDFSYRVVQQRGETMSDGYTVPGAFDGMGCFAGPGGTLVLMRNHELDIVGLPSAYASDQKPPAEAYDPDAYGAVTRLVLDEESLEPISSNLVLAGTARNCAGGVSPWGWLSCEETTAERHGYVFLCASDARRVARPRRIDGYGRYRHEAVCIEPATSIAYLTEDQGDGCLYRFIPRERDTPFEGRLQALVIEGRPSLDTGSGTEVGRSYRVRWSDVVDPTPPDDTVRHRARDRGAAAFRRGEGIWFHDGSVWFVATTGGAAERGQVFRLDLGRHERPDLLTLVAEAPTSGELDMPDNVTVSPSGEVFVAEDSTFGDQHLRIIAPTGEVSDFARSAAGSGELAGICFAPDGNTLFVNLYLDGITLAVRGPFHV